jgi:dipeptidyl aminopeptidase/acylaminoacyl peptidase
MNVWQTLARHGMPRRFIWLACALVVALAPLTLTGQVPQARPATPAATQAPAGQAAAPAAKPEAPLSWADKILQQEAYATPPPELAEAVIAPRYQNLSLSNLSPDKKWFLNMIGDGPVVMSTFAKPFHELGGVFIDFKANRVRSLTVSNSVGLQVVSAADGTRTPVAIPPNSRVSNATWSPDGSAVAYLVHTADATHIWMTDLATNRPRQVSPRPLLATFVSTFEFTKDGKQIAAVLIPDARPPMPVAPAAPIGPQVKVHDAKDKNRLRTFPSLMSTEYELNLLEWHATGQLALVDVPPAPPKDPKAKPARLPAGAGVKKVGQPTMLRSFDLSPDGKYARITRMTRPFSYIVPVGNFGSVDEVWDLTGKALAKISDRPLNLGTQDATAPDPSEPPAGGAAQQGKRELAWRDDGQGLSYLEQEPAPADSGTGARGARAAGGGGGRGGAGAGDQAAGAGRGQAAQRKDRLYQWLPPFEEKGAKVLFENNTRMNGLRYSPDMQTIFFRESAGSGTTASTVEVAVNLAEPTQRYTLARFRTDDPAANPGNLVGVRAGGGGGARGGGGGARGGGGGGGGAVLLSPDKTSVYYQGTLNDKNPEQVGPKTFIDRVVIKNGEKKRLFESDNKDVYESVSTVLDPEAGRFIIERQNPTTAPQFFLLEGTTRKQLTENKDLFPDLTSAPKQRVMVERPDGIKFSVSVMLPPGYQKGTRLPAIFWLYPREFTDQDAIDRPDRTFNKNSFQSFGTRSMQFFVRLGYAVIVDTPGAIPIVGPNGQQNNNYVNDLRNSLSAIIDELDRRALVDRTRLAIGGHSYGAFTTVNAMVHTPFFKAGIAGDGAYNRTLTPLGFQSERRDLWEAPNVYLGMSPFLYANNMTGALLMYHALGDQNVGTDPDNSIRLFHALNGLGKTAALYMYPLEDHGPVARETLLDLWARWAAWLDKYVKNPQKEEKKAEAGGK